MEGGSLLIILLIIFILTLFVFGMVLVLAKFALPKRKKFSFGGRHAFITGGSKGIGKQLAIALVRRGCSVSIAARNAFALETTCHELRSLARSLNNRAVARWFVLDVADSYRATESAIREAEQLTGPIDVLINNAGSSVQDAFDLLPIGDFEKQMRLNYLSAVFATRVVLKSIKRNGSGGHIAFVSSAAGQCPLWGYTAYGASKFAVRGLAESLFMELLPFNIGVSVLYPPNTNTEGFQEEKRTMPDEVREITNAAGLFSAEEVAEKAIVDIEAGYFSTSIGLEGWMLSMLSAGAAPETSFYRVLAQVFLAGLLRGVMLIYIGNFNKIVAECKAKHEREYERERKRKR